MHKLYEFHHLLKPSWVRLICSQLHVDQKHTRQRKLFDCHSYVSDLALIKNAESIRISFIVFFFNWQLSQSSVNSVPIVSRVYAHLFFTLYDFFFVLTDDKFTHRESKDGMDIKRPISTLLRLIYEHWTIAHRIHHTRVHLGYRS